MTVLTEKAHPAEFILSEAAGMRSRDNVKIPSGTGILLPGTVIGKLTGSPGSPIVGSVVIGNGNTGNGILTKGTPAFLVGVQAGKYRVVCKTAAANGGVFDVFDPNNVDLGDYTVGAAAFGVQIAFTIADGTQDFIVGDYFELNVGLTGGSYLPSEVGPSDGSEVAAGILIYGVDATSKDVMVAAIVRDAEVNQHCINWAASADTLAERGAKIAALAASGIIVR